MNKPKKRWSRYQVDGPKYCRPHPSIAGRTTSTKPISELTEAEAKDELCDSMDLIAKLVNAAHVQLDYARKAKYYV